MHYLALSTFYQTFTLETLFHVFSAQIITFVRLHFLSFVFKSFSHIAAHSKSSISLQLEANFVLQNLSGAQSNHFQCCRDWSAERYEDLNDVFYCSCFDFLFPLHVLFGVRRALKRFTAQILSCSSNKSDIKTWLRLSNFQWTLKRTSIVFCMQIFPSFQRKNKNKIFNVSIQQ